MLLMLNIEIKRKHFNHPVYRRTLSSSMRCLILFRNSLYLKKKGEKCIKRNAVKKREIFLYPLFIKKHHLSFLLVLISLYNALALGYRQIQELSNIRTYFWRRQLVNEEETCNVLVWTKNHSCFQWILVLFQSTLFYKDKKKNRIVYYILQYTTLYTLQA